MSDHAITQALISEVNFRLFEECVPRIKNCLSRLTDEQIWWRPNPRSNSIGNLILHLCGNVRQYIVSGLGGSPDNRNRDYEFEAKSGLNGTELFDLFNTTIS